MGEAAGTKRYPGRQSASRVPRWTGQHRDLMEVQSSHPWQQMVAVLEAGHSLPADEKEVVQEEGHNRYADEMEAVQQEEHSHCADAKAAALAEEHNHHTAAAADAPEAAQPAAHSLPVVVSQEAVPEEERNLHAAVADTAADMTAVAAAVDIAAGPGSGIPTGLQLLQPIHSAARYTDSSSHQAYPRDSAPAWVEDHWSFHSDRQNTLLTIPFVSVVVGVSLECEKRRKKEELKLIKQFSLAAL